MVDGDLLLALARATRDGVRCGFGYEAHDGASSRRTVEPYRLVVTGRRWYLMAYDLDRDDWRTFRLDRMRELAPSTWRFRRREHPDPVAFVQRAVVSSPYRFTARVRVHADAGTVTARVTPRSASVEPLGASTCLLVAGGDSLYGLAVHLAWLGHDLEILEPPELREVMAELGARMLAASRMGDNGAGQASDGRSG